MGLSRLDGNRPLIPDDTLWYSGDRDGVNGLANEKNSTVSDADTGRSFNSTTSGANGIGSPINGQSYFDSTYYNDNFAPAAGVLGQATADFSMGVGGTVTDSGGVVHHSHATTN